MGTTREQLVPKTVLNGEEPRREKLDETAR